MSEGNATNAGIATFGMPEGSRCSTRGVGEEKSEVGARADGRGVVS